MSTHKNSRSTTWIILSMVLGVVAGFVGGPVLGNIQFIGDIFFRLIQMAIIPFVMCSIIEAVGGLTVRDFTGVGLKGIIWFAVSSIAASAFGVLCAYIFQPGAGVDATALLNTTTAGNNAVQAMPWQETISAFFGANIIKSMADGAMVPCIVFSLALGFACSAHRQAHNGRSNIVYDFCIELEAHILGVIRAVMTIAPVGIFCYVSSMIGKLGLSILISLAKYLAVLAGAVAAFMVIWIVLVCIVVRIPATKLIKKMWRMSVVALGTISSAVTLPVEMEDAKHELGIREDIADLILPLGMPLNSNGASIHLTITALTIAQIFGMSVDSSMYISMIVVCTLLSLANAVAPGADLVSLTMIVPQLGLPLSSIGIFAGLTYPVGAIRTILNVDSDVYCALMVASAEPNGIDRAKLNS